MQPICGYRPTITVHIKSNFIKLTNNFLIMSELTKNVQPLADFDWNQFENGTTVNVSKEDLYKAYDDTLNKVSEHQVV